MILIIIIIIIIIVRRNLLNNRVAKQWNRLDESIIKLKPLTAFKNKIKMIILTIINYYSFFK